MYKYSLQAKYITVTLRTHAQSDNQDAATNPTPQKLHAEPRPIPTQNLVTKMPQQTQHPGSPRTPRHIQRRLDSPHLPIGIHTHLQQNLHPLRQIIRTHTVKRRVPVGINCVQVSSRIDEGLGGPLAGLAHTAHVERGCTAGRDFVCELGVG